MYIGIDLGTSSVKLLLTNKIGEIINTVKKNYPLIFLKNGFCEQNPNEWFNETISGLKELIVGNEDNIIGISFSGQMHGLVLLDKNDNILRNAILWNDQRTVKEVDFLNNTIGKEKLLKYTGNIALTGLTATKLLWVRNNEPDIFNKINKIMLPKDFLIYKLTNEFKTDMSDAAGTLYFDVNNKTYSKEMLSILNIKLTQLPKVNESYEIVGNLSLNIKKILNITKDIKVIAGGGDQAVGAIGVGCISEDICSISLGTSGVVLVSNNSFMIDKINHFQSYNHANGKYLKMGVMLNATGALNWWNKNIFSNYDYSSFFKNIKNKTSNNDLFFLPYINGERANINDSNIRGAFIGLAQNHTKYDMDLAVIEGICFSLKQMFDLIKTQKIKTVRLTGGGAKSKVWNQLLSDILDVSIETITNEEGPAFGACILAMVGSKTYDSVFDACKKFIKIKDIYIPNSNNNKIFSNKYKKFIKIYPAIKNLL